MIHEANCNIDGRMSVDEKIYSDCAVTVADVNRIYRDWEAKLPHFVKARVSLVGADSSNLPADILLKKMFLLGIMFATEELLRATLKTK
jgi:hypothetical protein